MIVVDTNVVAYLMIAGDKLHEAQQVRDRDDVWRVPLLWRFEFTNVLVSHVKYRNMSEEESGEILQQAVSLFGAVERDVDAQRALQLARKYALSGSDAQYLALAEQLDCWCITEDRAFCHAASNRVRNMREFLQ